MGDREMGRDVKANTKRVRHTPTMSEAQKKRIFSWKVVRKQVSRLFQSLCRPSSSNHFTRPEMLMKADESELNAKWWRSRKKGTGSGGSDRRERKSRPWASEHYYHTKGGVPEAHRGAYVTGWLYVSRCLSYCSNKSAQRWNLHYFRDKPCRNFCHVL